MRCSVHLLVDYVGFIKRVLKLLQTGFRELKRLELHLKLIKEPVVVPLTKDYSKPFAWSNSWTEFAAFRVPFRFSRVWFGSGKCDGATRTRGARTRLSQRSLR